MDVDSLLGFYKKAATSWHEPTFLSEIAATPSHILFFDLDIYITGDSVWTAESTHSTVVYFLNIIKKMVVEDEVDLACIVTGAEPQQIHVPDGDDVLKVFIIAVHSI